MESRYALGFGVKFTSQFRVGWSESRWKIADEIPSVNFFPKSRTESGIGREGRRSRHDSVEAPVNVGSPGAVIVKAEFAGKSGAIPSVNFFPKSRTKSGIGEKAEGFTRLL